MEALTSGMRLFRENDPILGYLNIFDPYIQPVIPLYLYVYISELSATVQAFAKTFKEKECTRHYCKNSKRSLQIIKFLWLFYLPIVLATSPRHVVVAQVCLLFSASTVLYVAALRTAAKCINALMLTSVSVKLQLHKLTQLPDETAIYLMLFSMVTKAREIIRTCSCIK